MPQDLGAASLGRAEVAAGANAAAIAILDRLLWFYARFPNVNSAPFGKNRRAYSGRARRLPRPRPMRPQEMIAKYDAGEIGIDALHNQVVRRRPWRRR
jgi:hypothetical protein